MVTLARSRHALLSSLSVVVARDGVVYAHGVDAGHEEARVGRALVAVIEYVSVKVWRLRHARGRVVHGLGDDVHALGVDQALKQSHQEVVIVDRTVSRARHVAIVALHARASADVRRIG